MVHPAPYRSSERANISQNDEREKHMPPQAARSLRNRKRGRGFALVEVVVSIFIIGIMIVVSASLLNGIPASRLALSQSIALSVAQNQMETLRAAGYAALPESGSFTDTALGALASGAGTITVAAYDSETKRVDVSVAWIEKDANPQSITLTTLITETGGL